MSRSVFRERQVEDKSLLVDYNQERVLMHHQSRTLLRPFGNGEIVLAHAVAERVARDLQQARGF